MTKKELTIRGLLNRGYKEIPSKSKRYRCFHLAGQGGSSYCWVGKSGGLRSSHHESGLAKSKSHTHGPWHAELMGK